MAGGVSGHDVDGDLECSEEPQDYISTEHVSLTKELQQQQALAIEELGNIMTELEIEDEGFDRTDLLSVIRHLQKALKNSKLKPIKSDLTEDEFISADLIDIDGISDERLKLEAELRNRDVMLEKYEDRAERLKAILKEKDFKLTEVTCQLTTAELKMKLLEDQIEIFEKDLNRVNFGSSSDNLSDAIEERNIAIKEKNAAWIELSQTKGELIQTNNQLMEVINQKVKLGQQLEHWQLDMQKLLEDQIEIKLARNVGLTKF